MTLSQLPITIILVMLIWQFSPFAWYSWSNYLFLFKINLCITELRTMFCPHPNSPSTLHLNQFTTVTQLANSLMMYLLCVCYMPYLDMSIVNQLDVMYYDRSLWIKYFVSYQQGLMPALMFHLFSFLNFDLYFKRHILGNFRSYGLAYVPKCYQYSWCNQ